MTYTVSYRQHPRDEGLPFGRKIRVRKEKRDKTPEAAIQTMTEAYLNVRGVAYFRVPDAAYRAIFAGSASTGTKVEAAAYLKGFPDLMIFRNGKYLALELKRDGGKMSAAQRRWRDAVGTQTAFSFEEAQAAIDKFLEGADK